MHSVALAVFCADSEDGRVHPSTKLSASALRPGTSATGMTDMIGATVTIVGTETIAATETTAGIETTVMIATTMEEGKRPTRLPSLGRGDVQPKPTVHQARCW
jgi:hypothetical protein